MSDDDRFILETIKKTLLNNLDVKSDRVFLPIGLIAMVYRCGPTKTLHIKNLLVSKYGFFMENAKGGIIIKRLHFYASLPKAEQHEEFNKWADRLKARDKEQKENRDKMKVIL